jgi:uncharacterized protein (TIGR03083 family)
MDIPCAIASLSNAMIADGVRNLDAAVEHCPGWAVRDLLVHIGDVQWFWAEVVSNRVTDRTAVTAVKPDDRGDAAEWFASQTCRLAAALAAAPDDTRVWTWWAPLQNVGFVGRRQLIEVAVHGWDARNAVGSPSPIDRDVALVGLDEFVEVMSTDLRSDAPPPPPVHLVATDASWKATLFGDSTAGPPVQLTGSASDLLLTLWGRHAAADPAVTTAIRAVDLS